LDCRDRLTHALRWLTWTPVYDLLLETLSKTTMRKTRTSFDDEMLTTLIDVRKLVPPTTAPIAWCNGFPRHEERVDDDRLRPLFEPTINDVIKGAPQGTTLYTTTAYT
jgi:hypothetical protein